MKTITDATSAFFIDNGYVDTSDFIPPYAYSCLSEEQKQRYIEGADGNYYHVVTPPKFSPEELDLALKLGNNSKLVEIKDSLKNMKICVFIITAILIVTTLISLISAIVSYSATKSAMKSFENALYEETDDYDFDF